MKLRNTKIIKTYIEEPYLALFISLLAALLLMPWSANNYEDHFVTQTLLSLIVIGGVLTFDRNRQLFRKSLVIGLVLIGLGWVSEVLQNRNLIVIHFFLLTIMMVYLTFNVIRNNLKAKEVNLHVILGSLCGYMMLGLTAAFVIGIIVYYYPEAIYFSHTDSPKLGDVVYYTFITLTTIGYGDAVPIHNIVKGMSYTLGIIGQFYMTVLVAFLMGKFLSK
jgi:hypothetical protein